MCRILGAVAGALVAALILCEAATASSTFFVPFSTLVYGSDTVAIGTVTSRGRNLVFTVRRALKGTLPKSVVLSVKDEAKKLAFDEKGEVMLFLERAPGAKHAAVLEHVWSKWPAPLSGNDRMVFDPHFADAKLPDLEKAVPTIAGALCDTKSYEFVNAVAYLLKSKERLLRIAGLEEAEELNFSGIFQTDASDARQRATWALAALALPHADDTDWQIRNMALQAIARGPASVAMPVLLSRIDDSTYCRKTARTWTDTILGKCKVSYDALKAIPQDADTDEDRAQIKASLTALWDSVKAEQLTEDTKVIRQRISSESPLEKESALLFLSRISK